ncbi:MAG: hypothetical protein EXX96DRAFT_562234 [Benjaminiella poitrasii]|nr:MAG: hypothetical protein EXX96DRAFT_562234 [Benjaminiella poitrasii]
MANLNEDEEYHLVSINASHSTLNNRRQRVLTDINNYATTRIIRSSFHLNLTSRRWHWWNYLALVVALVLFIEVIVLIVCATLLTFASDPVSFSIQNYPKITYQPLDTSTPIVLPADSSVYHVTKEFGPATMGGMGTVLTAIAQAQLRTGKIKPYVVLPFYSFLRRQEQYPIKKTVDLVTTFRNDRGDSIPVAFRVSELQYDFEPIEHFESLSNEEKIEIMANRSTMPTVTVYLIGYGKVDPLSKAFKASSITGIYSSPKGLPQEWKDQYFAKAAASFLIWKAAGKHELSLFAPLNTQPRVDVIHLHGATNAYVAKYLVEHENQLGDTPPSIVYTMHDYLDELQYTNTLPNVKRFLDTPRSGRSLQQEIDHTLLPYMFGSQKVFMSPLGIESAEIVTFVSQTMTKDIVEGRLDFYLKEIVMKSLLHKAEQQQFYGISNGLDFSGAINPFTESKLVKAGLNYPAYARSLINNKVEMGQRMNNATIDTITAMTFNYWTLSTEKSNYVIERKQRAKQYLMEKGLLNADDLNRPLVLFVGRFQYNKGLETFEEAARLFQSYNMKFAIIGQPNNYPLDWVQRLASQYPEHIVLLRHISEQKESLTYFRAAADIVYVPSVTESFGLVAAEGLMFGSSVISTGTGGLSEFLVDRVSDEDTPPIAVTDNTYIESYYRHNAYLFNAMTPGSLAESVRDAASDLEFARSSAELHEEYVLRMMLSAYSLGWNRGGEQGPVYDYLRIYQQAILDKRSKSSFAIHNDSSRKRS